VPPIPPTTSSRIPNIARCEERSNAFSKKVENHAHAVSLHFMHYNFGGPHETLTKKCGKPTTPAMAAGIERHPWSLTQIAELLD
jgi:hypothetical protein